MKKVVLLLVLTILLTSCDQMPTIQPTITDKDMQTKVARILTSYPTSTPGAFQATPEIQISQEAVEEATAAPDTESSPEVTEMVEASQGGMPTNTPPISIPTLAPTETPFPTMEPTATVYVAEATPTMSGNDPAYKLGTPSWDDPMDISANWPVEGNEYTSVSFKDGFMQFSGLKKDNGWRLSVNDIENFYMEMTVRSAQCTGTDRYGLMIRVPDRKAADRGYWFQINCKGQYAFQKWDGSEDPGKVTGLIGWTTNAAINAGSLATNRLGVMAIGDTYTLYANGIKLATAEDDSWLKGGFGVVIGAKETNNMTVYVDQIRYWLNPVQ
ncbi:MAG: hypothetical protein AB9891_01900 [Anaerolineaceae bacterium]